MFLLVNLFIFVELLEKKSEMELAAGRLKLIRDLSESNEIIDGANNPSCTTDVDCATTVATDISQKYLNVVECLFRI